MAQDKELNSDERRQKRQRTRHWVAAAIIVYAVSFVLLAGVGAYSIYRGQQVNRQLCRVADDNRSILLQMLDVAEGQSLSRTNDIPERNIIRQSYNELRALVPPLKCSLPGGPQELEP